MSDKDCECGCTECDEGLDLQEQQDSTVEETITLKKNEYESLVNKCKEAEEKLVYAYADFDNYKKRNQKHFNEQLKFANESIIKELLPIIDNLTLANVHACSCTDKEGVKLDKFIEGVDLISKQMKEVFSKYGVQEIDAVGKTFDPQYHEAMNHAESEEHEEGCVVDEYQKGYSMNGRLLRSAKVSICKKKEGGE